MQKKSSKKYPVKKPPKSVVRERAISLGILTSVSVMLIGCDETPRVAQSCVSEDGIVVQDVYCDQSATNPQVVHHHAPGYNGLYRWYYANQVHGIGDRVGGGSYAVPANHEVVRGSSIGKGGSLSPSRGVMGSSGSKFGGFGS